MTPTSITTVMSKKKSLELLALETLQLLSMLNKSLQN